MNSELLNGEDWNAQFQNYSPLGNRTCTNTIYKITAKTITWQNVETLNKKQTGV